MQSYYVRQLLTESQVDEITRLMPMAQWGDSQRQLDNYLEGYQDNMEMLSGPTLDRISSIVMGQVNGDLGFYDRVFPLKSTPVIVSTTFNNKGFKVHHDDPTVGEFSTTVFLSNPETYEGGELKIWYEGEVQTFKLPAGWAITYETGAPHSVAPVTFGGRMAAVFWTTSRIRDERHRRFLSEMKQIRRLLPPTLSYNFDEANASPYLRLQQLENTFIRTFVNLPL